MAWLAVPGFVIASVAGIVEAYALRCPRCGRYLDWYVRDGEGGSLWFRLPLNIGCRYCGADFDDPL